MKLVKLVLATRNNDKILEIKEALRGLAIDICTVDRFPTVPDVVEDGLTIEQNALKKARVVHHFTGELCLADDTGLEVDFLDGEPGVFSSRFAGENASYDDNVAKLLSLLQGAPAEKRTARFRCIIALVGKSLEQTIEGIAEGCILTEKRGTGGFGYDPVFYFPAMGKTFAEISLKDKNSISHRGVALAKVRLFLEKLSAR